MLVYFLILSIGLQFQTGSGTEEFLTRNYTIEDGLPLNSVSRIIQDDAGYLYFSTLDGLARYDGYQFTIYNSKNTEGIKSNRIIYIERTGNDDLWLLYSGGALTRKSENSFTTFSRAQGEEIGEVASLRKSEDGNIWIACDNGVFIMEAGNNHFKPHQSPGMQLPAYRLEADPHGGMLVVNENGLFFLNTGEPELVIKADDFPIPHALIRKIKVGNGYIWLSGEDGAFRYIPETQEIDFTFRPDSSGMVIWNQFALNDGSYLFSTTQGYFRYDEASGSMILVGEEFSSRINREHMVLNGAGGEHIHIGLNEVYINGSKALETEEIRSAFLDAEGSLWISTFNRGVYQIRKSMVQNISSDRIPGFENIYPVIETPDGALWAGTLRSGIYRLKGESVSQWDLNNSSLTRNFARFLHNDADTVYAGMWGSGLWKYEDGDWRHIPEFERAAGANTTVEAMHRDRNGRLWIGSAGPLVYRQHGLYHRYSEENLPELMQIRVIRESEDGTLFLGTASNGLSVIRNNEVLNYTMQSAGLNSDLIRDVYLQSPDTVWVATENLGLNRLIFDEMGNLAQIVSITTENGLIHNSLHRIIEDKEGKLWISSNNGVMRIDSEELSGVADGKQSRLRVLGFNERDGMRNREANGGVMTSGLLSSMGLIIFPNQAGLTVMNPAEIGGDGSQRMAVPVIESVIAGEKLLYPDSEGRFVLPENVRNLRIQFTAPNFKQPERMDFRYMMEGVHDTWESGTSGREAIFTNLPPGNHRFRLLTRPGDDTGYEAETAIILTIPRKLHETGFFYVLMLILTAGLVYGGFRFRIRALRQREQTLKQLVERQTEDLRKAADDKSRFFSGITHELKTPLALIQSPLEDILSEPDSKGIPGDLRKRLGMMYRNSRRLNHLTDQMLQVTRLNADAIRLTHYPVDPARLIRQASGQFQSRLEYQKITLKVDLAPVDGPFYCNPDVFERILINLLSNAIRFSPPESQILITLRDEGENIVFSVQDQGPGIPEKDQEKIFEYLFQVEGAGAAEGTGIGLYLVKGLVEHMNGRVRLVSEEGKGAAFFITLQKGYAHFAEKDTVLHEAQAGNDNKEPFRAEKTDKRDHDADTLSGEARGHILVVEDNLDFREYLKSVLQPRYVVTTASDGNEALALLDDTPADLVLSDVMMPGMDGIELISTLRKEKKFEQLPVIFLSAKHLEKDIATGLSTGADLYLTKPIGSRMLLAQVDALMRREMLLKSSSTEQEAAEPLVNKVRELILRHLANPELNINLLADALFISRSKLYDDWKESEEQSLNQYIRKLRMEEAHHLLTEQNYSVKEAARAVGYTRQGYFSASFKKHFGYSPSDAE